MRFSPSGSSSRHLGCLRVASGLLAASVCGACSSDGASPPAPGGADGGALTAPSGTFGSGTPATTAGAAATAATSATAGQATSEAPTSASNPDVHPDAGAQLPAASSMPPANGEPVASNTCSGELPASFTTLCAGCHTASGAANPRYPDLFAYGGSQAAFSAQVRSGSAGMAAYGEALISDADLSTIHTYFSTTSRSGTSTVTLGGITPLFVESDAETPPVVFTRDDGVLITRGSGRVRQRHELEGTFNAYGPHYFEDRSFGFLIEDYTPTGESLIRVSYLPVGTPTEGTNFRCWKIYGDGNVFHLNMGMDPAELPAMTAPNLDLGANYQATIAEFSTVQAQKTTSNPRTGAPLAAGDVFEFEFGVFLEPGAVREGSRTSYYSDTFRYQVGQGGLNANNADTAGQLGPLPAAQQGGSGTNVWLYEDGEFAFEQMALNIQHENTQRFLRGRRLFHTDFDTGAHSEPGNPNFDEQAGKAGPLLNATRCESCHLHDGPGKQLESFDEDSSMTFKLSDAPELGNQLQLTEGSASVEALVPQSVTLADGSEVALMRPTFSVKDPGGAALRFSPRVARKLIGLGLLEAIDESTLLQRQDPNDCNADGISGRAHLVRDPDTDVLRVGRFGWKAEKVSVQHQVVDALAADLGVSSATFPEGDGSAELDGDDVADVTAYMRLLSVPAQRDVEAAEVRAGEQLFSVVGCTACHVTDVVTGRNHPFAELRSQAIRPYTDLLLHDMGADLADESGVEASHDERAPAAASEWRTPPLWGIGLLAQVNGNTGLLHDARAADVQAAILWHGGEAEAARTRFVNLDPSEREQLLAFVNSL